MDQLVSHPPPSPSSTSLSTPLADAIATALTVSELLLGHASSSTSGAAWLTATWSRLRVTST